jgi:condensin complex subunit 3
MSTSSLHVIYLNAWVHLSVVRPFPPLLSSPFPYFPTTPTNNPTGEEKKLLAPLLQKLHVSPASTPSLLRETYAEVSSAIDGKLIADATGRNALFKIHVSLGKIVNSLKEKDDEGAGLRESMRSSVNSRKSRESVAPSVVGEEDGESEKAVPQGGKGKEVVGEVDEDDEDEGTVIGDRRDSLVSELLSDGDVEMSGL